MSNHPEFSPASLRILQFKYAREVEINAPDTDPSLALENYNTSRLKDGALACVYSPDGGGFEGGQPRIYFFKKSYSGPPQSAYAKYLIVPKSGGGAWAEKRSGGIIYQADNPGGGLVALTAGAGLQEVVAPFEWNWHYLGAFAGLVGKVTVFATSMVQCGAVAGAQVNVQLQGAAYNHGVAPSFSAIAQPALATLLADQYMQVMLIGKLSLSDEDHWAVRVMASATDQDAAITNTQVYYMISAETAGTY